jgi:hypothetical protein
MTDRCTRRSPFLARPRAAVKAAISSQGGMKLAQPWRVATIAPQALRNLAAACQPWPRTRP